MSFDGTAIAWYAAVCGILSAFAPSFGGRIARIIIGGIVGVVAASVLPAVRGMTGL